MGVTEMECQNNNRLDLTLDRSFPALPLRLAAVKGSSTWRWAPRDRI